METIAIARQTLVGFGSYALPMALLKGGRFSKVLLRSAFGFAVFTGGYRLMRIILKRLVAHFRRRRSVLLPPSVESQLERYSPAVSAAVAAFLGNAVDPSYSSSFFVIWLFLRAVRTLSFMPSNSWIAPAAMVAAVEVIVPAGFNNPEEVHPTYRVFLESFGCGVDLSKMRNPGKLAIGDVVHPYKSDASFMLQYLYPSLALKACNVYWPLHTVGFGVNWLFRGKGDFAALAENILRSTAFLTGWVGTMWWAVMLHSRWLVKNQGEGKVHRRHTMVWSWLGGLYVLLEKPGRQVELATYCSAHAINAVYNRYRGSKDYKGAGTALLMTSCALLLHHWSKEPNFVKKLLFGSEVKDF